jgi:uncharacterized protein with HEPN domain
MPKRVIEFFAIDILVSIEKVKRYSSGHNSAEAFFAEEMAFAATLRELEIIGEAVRMILDHEPYEPFLKKKWRIIVDCRNVIAHGYFGITISEIYRITQKNIPSFEQEFIDFLKKIRNDKLFLAITDVKEEFTNSKRLDSLDYLKKIEQVLKHEF